MNKYEMRSSRARLVDAIGIFYLVIDVVEAESREEAERVFRNKWEFQSSPIIYVMKGDTYANTKRTV